MNTDAKIVDGLEVQFVYRGHDWYGERVRQRTTDEWFGMHGPIKVAAFHYADIDGRMFLSKAHTFPAKLWGKGIGRRMIAAAVERYGEVYAYSGNADPENRDMSLWLTASGRRLVDACIREGIMQSGWIVDARECDDDRARP